jgi:hypothetical protein
MRILIFVKFQDNNHYLLVQFDFICSDTCPWHFVQSPGILGPQVLTEVTQKEERAVAPSHSAITVAEIDCTVKKYADNLLHALEGVSARLSQLESRTHHMESSMDDLKLVISDYTGAADGKLRQFENILREVCSLHYKYYFHLIVTCSCCCSGFFLML